MAKVLIACYLGMIVLRMLKRSKVEGVQKFVRVALQTMTASMTLYIQLVIAQLARSFHLTDQISSIPRYYTLN